MIGYAHTCAMCISVQSEKPRNRVLGCYFDTILIYKICIKKIVEIFYLVDRSHWDIILIYQVGLEIRISVPGIILTKFCGSYCRSLCLYTVLWQTWVQWAALQVQMYAFVPPISRPRWKKAKFVNHIGDITFNTVLMCQICINFLDIVHGSHISKMCKSVFLKHTFIWIHQHGIRKQNMGRDQAEWVWSR